MTSYRYPSGATVVLAPGAGPADEAWHEARLHGLGGSDMAAVCGLDKYRSPLEIWHEKAGQPAQRRDDPVLDEAALMGHLLEPVVAQRFQAITELPFYPTPGTLQAQDPAWALVNLDGVTLERGEYGVVECKTRSSYALQDWVDEPPTGPYLQVQHALMVTGWSFGYTACLIGGQRTIVHRIERDEQLITGLRTIGAEFWQRVQDRTPPPVDGTEATRDLLHRLHPDADGTAVVADAAEVEELLRQRADGKATADAANAQVTAAENRLKAIAGNHTEVHIRGQKAYSWPKYSRRGAIDWRELAADFPEIDIESYRAPASTYRQLRVHLENL